MKPQANLWRAPSGSDSRRLKCVVDCLGNTGAGSSLGHSVPQMVSNFLGIPLLNMQIDFVFVTGKSTVLLYLLYN